MYWTMYLKIAFTISALFSLMCTVVCICVWFSEQHKKIKMMGARKGQPEISHSIVWVKLEKEELKQLIYLYDSASTWMWYGILHYPDDYDTALLEALFISLKNQFDSFTKHPIGGIHG